MEPNSQLNQTASAKRVNTSIHIRPIFGNEQRFVRKLPVKFFQFLFKSTQATTIPSIIKIKPNSIGNSAIPAS